MPESPSANRDPTRPAVTAAPSGPSPSFSSTTRKEAPQQQAHEGGRSITIMRRVRSWSSLNRGEEDDDDDGRRAIVRDAEQLHHIKDKQQAAGGATCNRGHRGGGDDEEGVAAAASNKAGFLYWRQVARILLRWLEWRREIRQQQRELCRKFFDDCSPRTMSSDEEDEEVLEQQNASSRSWPQRGGRGRYHDSHQPAGSARPRQQREWRDGGGASSSSTESDHQYRGTFTDDDDDDDDMVVQQQQMTAMYSLIESILNGRFEVPPLPSDDDDDTDSPSLGTLPSNATSLHCFTDGDASTVVVPQKRKTTTTRSGHNNNNTRRPPRGGTGGQGTTPTTATVSSSSFHHQGDEVSL